MAYQHEEKNLIPFVFSKLYTLHIKQLILTFFLPEHKKELQQNFLKSSQWKFYTMNLHVRHQESEAVEWKKYIVSFLLLLLFYANKPKGEKISFHSHFKAYFKKEYAECFCLAGNRLIGSVLERNRSASDPSYQLYSSFETPFKLGRADELNLLVTNFQTLPLVLQNLLARYF